MQNERPVDLYFNYLFYYFIHNGVNPVTKQQDSEAVGQQAIK